MQMQISILKLSQQCEGCKATRAGVSLSRGTLDMLLFVVVSTRAQPPLSGCH